MGASREAVFSCLSEIVIFLNFSALAVLSKSFSLSQMIGESWGALWASSGPSLMLVIASYFMILLVENSRIPIDDPATHLECQDKACVEVDGAGGDECLEDYHCKYTTCEDEACVTKECDDGSCKSSCLEDDHCAEDRETHLACRNQSCVIVDGAGSNQCSTSSDCSVLTSTNRAVTQVPDTGVFEKTLVVTVAASALIFLGLILATL